MQDSSPSDRTSVSESPSAGVGAELEASKASPEGAGDKDVAGEKDEAGGKDGAGEKDGACEDIPVGDNFMVLEDTNMEELAQLSQLLPRPSLALPSTPPSKPRKPGENDDGKSQTKAGQVAAQASRKATKKNTRQCRGCTWWHQPTSMSTDVRLCHLCKNRVDNISRIAKSQQKSEWWRSVRSNDVQLSQILNEYTKRVGPSTGIGGGRRPARSATFQHLERVIASTAMIVESIGRFMTRKQFMCWAESIDGHRCSEVGCMPVANNLQAR